jgi:hypothetical protein
VKAPNLDAAYEYAPLALLCEVSFGGMGAPTLPPTLPPNYPDQEVEYRLMREREAGEARPLLEELRRLLAEAKGRG